MTENESTQAASEKSKETETVKAIKSRRALIGFVSYERAFDVMRETDKSMLDITGSKQRQAEFRIAHSQASEDIPALEYPISDPTVRDIPDTPEIQDHISAVTDSDRFESYISESEEKGWESGLVPIEQLIAGQGIITVPEESATVSTWDEDPVRVIQEMLPLEPSGDEYFLRDFITERDFGFEFISRSSSLHVSPEEMTVVEAPNPVQARVVVDVLVEPNFVTVARLDDRLILEQGYQRVYQQFMNGATHVPAIIRDCAEYEQLREVNTDGLLSREIILSDRPPVIPDYDSSAAIELEGRERNTVITISARETEVIR